jgi:hypothetical protein
VELHGIEVDNDPISVISASEPEPLGCLLSKSRMALPTYDSKRQNSELDQEGVGAMTRNSHCTILRTFRCSR